MAPSTSEFNGEILLDKLWDCGKWQLFVFNLISFLFICQACWPIINYNFIQSQIEHHCKIGVNETLNDTIPYNAVKNQYSECSMYNNSYLNTTKSCTNGYTYIKPDDWMTTSIVSEWNLVCDRSYLTETTQAIFMAGVLVGGAGIPTLADKFGRKPVHIICQMLGVAVGVALAFIPTLETFMVFKFLAGVMREGSGLTGIVWVLEYMPSRFRALAGAGFQIYWVFWWCAFVVFAYFLREWRWLQLATALPPLLTLVLIWLVPESVTWLYANKKNDELKSLIRNHADRFNKKKFSDEDMVAMEKSCGTMPLLQRDDGYKDDADDAEEVHIYKYTLIDILKSNRLIVWTLALNYLWFQNVSGYYGLGYLATLTAGDKYISFLLNGLVEIPAYVLAMILCHFWGRKYPIILHQFLAGVCLIVAGFLPESLQALNLTLTLIARYALTFTFAVIIFFTQEIYPTNLRNAGLGYHSAVGRIAALVCPYASFIARIHPWLPTVIFGGMALLGGVFAIILPETRGKQFPEKLEDLDTWNELCFPAKHEPDRTEMQATSI